MKNTKGQVGLDTAKVVMLALLVLAVFSFVALIVWSSLGNTTIAKTSSGTISIVNETVTSVNELGDLLPTADSQVDCAATVSTAINSTSGTVIPASNFTVSGCTISFNSGQGNSQGFNNSNWNVTYGFTFNQYGNIENNLTRGTASFFSNATTWFALLGVVIIILIIAIVIFAVNRFGSSGSGSFGRSRGEASL